MHLKTDRDSYIEDSHSLSVLSMINDNAVRFLYLNWADAIHPQHVRNAMWVGGYVSLLAMQRHIGREPPALSYQLPK